LDGGEGLAVRVGDVVLKPVHDEAEAAWTQSLLDRVVLEGVRIAPPVATDAGVWVHDGWAASRFVSDLRPAAPDWARVADAGLRFGVAVEAVRRGGEDVLARRHHRWAVADRVAWGEAEVTLPAPATDLREEIAARLVGTADGERHFVHGDLAGNVFLDPDDVPVVLDVSPYLRPRRWAEAIVVVDAVLWERADPDLARALAADAATRDLLGRALTYRLVAEQVAGDPRHGALLHPYRALLVALG
jgi:uncharacterized protein (TIGR02569 family)